MNWDFNREDEQHETSRLGPVPAGSIVLVAMKLIEPLEPGGEAFVKTAQSGLRMLYGELAVERGQYAGVSWRQHIMPPAACRKSASLLDRKQPAALAGPLSRPSCRLPKSRLR